MTGLPGPLRHLTPRKLYVIGACLILLGIHSFVAPPGKGRTHRSKYTGKMVHDEPTPIRDGVLLVGLGLAAIKVGARGKTEDDRTP